MLIPSNFFVLTPVLLFIVFNSLRIIFARVGYLHSAELWSFLLQVTLCGFACLCVFLLPFIYTRVKELICYRPRVFLLVLGINIWHFGLGTSLSIAATKYAPAPNIAFLAQFTLFFQIVWEFLFFKERVNRKILISAPFSFLGLWLLVTNGTGFSPSHGDLLILAATFFWSISDVVSRHVLVNNIVVPEVIAFFRPLGFIVCIPVFLILRDFYPFSLAGVDFSDVGNLHILPWALLTGASLALTWIFLTRSYKLMKVSQMSLICMAYPVLVTVLSVLFLSEGLKLLQLVGAVLILASSTYLILVKENKLLLTHGR